jgi:signal transduction histidine kinase
MSLRVKTILIIVSTLAALVLILFVTLSLVLVTSYSQLEGQNIELHLDRILNSLTDELTTLSGTTSDWAHWDDTYQFVQTLDPTYVEANLVDETLINLNINAMIFADTDGTILYEKFVDFVEGSQAQLPIGVSDYLRSNSPIVQHLTPTSHTEGIISSDGGPMLVASRPILTSSKQGPIEGVLIFARLMDATYLEALSSTLRLSINLYELDATTLPDDVEAARNHISAQVPKFVQASDAARAAGYTLVNDVKGEPAFIVKVDVDRTIYQQGLTSLTYLIGALILAGLIFALITAALLEKTVVSRLVSLTNDVREIHQQGNPTLRVSEMGADELGGLASDINEMLGRLEQTQNKLQLARDEAVQALRVKSQILSNMSHESRTPLSLISLRTQMMQRGNYGSVTAQQAAVLEGIIGNVNQLDSFIEKLLSEAQLNTGTRTPQKANFVAAHLLDEIAERASPLALKKGLRFYTHCADDLPPILYGDVELIREIAMHLVDNAIKFTDQGHIDVTLLRYNSTQWGLQVIDTGIGVPKSAQEAIFEPFWQVDSSDTRKVMTGIGLGLSIARKLAKLLGGDIEVSSETEKGSTFTLVLPLEQVVEGV